MTIDPKVDCSRINVRAMDSVTLIFSNKRQIWKLIKRLIVTAFLEDNEELKYFIRITSNQIRLVYDHASDTKPRT